VLGRAAATGAERVRQTSVATPANAMDRILAVRDIFDSSFGGPRRFFASKAPNSLSTSSCRRLRDIARTLRLFSGPFVTYHEDSVDGREIHVKGGCNRRESALCQGGGLGVSRCLVFIRLLWCPVTRLSRTTW
jgi:hypothetical protein